MLNSKKKKNSTPKNNFFKATGRPNKNKIKILRINQSFQLKYYLELKFKAFYLFIILCLSDFNKFLESKFDFKNFLI